jgi:hypothetical protein
MNRLREIMKDKRVAGALAVVAFILVAYRLLPIRGTETRDGRPDFGPAGKHREGAPAERAEPPPAAQQRAKSLHAPDDPGPEVAWSWQRNPFLPAENGEPAGVGSGFSARPSEPVEGRGMPADLRGTVVAGRIGMAIFGSRLVPVGGTIGDWTVERVEPYRVAMRKGAETRMVEMFKPEASGAEGRGGKR